ncbi:hypothetical protein Taro_047103 [Colocasia esculenta]|uniref:Disease resistance protein RPS2 n=1 Tax=Colocasia esculenta TaxID=4460 RepID=A0A843WRW4_COLES|nr:hypothetical protein [Colocasia esculenta]
MSTLDPIRPVSDAAVNAVADKVGNLVGTCWDYSLGLVMNIIFLSRKADEVAGEMKGLQGLMEDLRQEAEAEARSTTQADVSNQLRWWMSKVSSLATDASKFQKSFEDQSFCVTRFRLGYDAVELLRQAKELTEEGKAISSARLARPRGPDPVQQVPSEICSSTLKGGREALQRVESYIMDDRVGIIGIYGMGGVGKTSLLKIINNEFLLGEACQDKFEVAIWVTVSRDVQNSTIRKSIADRLRLPSDTPKDDLFGQLSKKRFILLLDDVWEKLNFEEIGIPLPKISKNRSKILFTTRSEQVCGGMDFDQKVKINPLDDKSSWDLFWSKFGMETTVLDVDPVIQQLAKEVVGRCGGLPVALITVGRAMSDAKTTNDWKEAIRKLDQCASQLSPGRIIDYCICEGFLDLEDFDEHDIEDTRCRGNALISELQNACLLEEVSDDFVMMHDTVRDMALWIAGHDFVVLAGSNVVASQIPRCSIWERAKRISLMHNRGIKAAPFFENLRSCPNLTTLLLQGSPLIQNVSKGFFDSMPTLRVLDLADSGLSVFPIEITSLTSLQYLCLSSNFYFTSLPVELGNLTNLRQLILRHTWNLTSIPREAISRLSRLQVLNMEWSGYKFGGDDTRRPLEMGLSDLANLSRLVELHLPKKICSWRTLGVIEASPVLQQSARNIYIRASCDASVPPPPSGDTITERIGRLPGLRSLVLLGEPSDPVMGELQLYPVSRLQNLTSLTIKNFREAKISINISSHSSEPLFPRLRDLWIQYCDEWSELTWVGRLPCLQRLTIKGCQGLREVLLLDGGGQDQLMITPFPKLTTMDLQNLPSLTSISMSTLPFPSLKWLTVRRCPRLKRLPFGPPSAKNLQRIEGQKAWWDGLEWNNHADQQSVSSKFELEGADVRVQTVCVASLVVCSVSCDIFLTLPGLRIRGWRSKGRVLGGFQVSDSWVVTNINLLDDKSSWDLFRSKFGRDAAVLDVDPHIRQLAKEVVGRCGGLPIALITVGMAMSNAKTAYDWKDAIRKLDQCASQLSPGMEEVLKSLKFSFEKLKNEALRNCLLYCALFSEDYKIPKVEIIDYWICEGFLDLEDFDEHDIEDTRCRGNALISELQNACLLEEVSDNFVMLHDTVRDMALWIAGHDFVVLAGSNSNATQVPKLSIWEMARRISLIRNEKIEELPSSSSSSSPCRNLSFPNLTTLLLQSSLLAKNVPEGFFTFTSMPTLRVLDLARTGLSEFPIEITSLTCLQYLSLSENEFTSLPVELGNLTNLRQLILRNTLHLTSISREAISHLSRLQVLDMEWSDYEFGDDDTRPLEMGLSDLANLSRLVEFHLPKYKYWSWRSFGVFEASPVLRRSIRSLGIRASCDASGDSVSPQPSANIISERVGRLSGLRRLELQGESYDPVMGELQLYHVSRLQNLVFLRIEDFRVAKISINISSCHGSEPLFPRLRELRIKSCDGWSEMTWLGLLPCLEELYIGHCKGLKEVLMQLDGDGHDHLMITPFPKLTSMNLQNLPSLTSINIRPLPFLSLKRLVVRGCPRLKRLPFGPQSAKNLTHIFGQEAWWDGLEWDNDADQQSFSSKFIAIASLMPATL